MRYGRAIYLTGKVVLVLGASMLLPLLMACIWREPDRLALALGAGVCLGVGLGLWLSCRCYRLSVMRQREAYLFVTAVWVAAALLGALPYWFYQLRWGGVGNYMACVFESISGFTTTGATVITNVEIIPRGLLLWRSLSHWLGGAGIVLLFVALIQSNNSAEGLNLYRAEYSGGVLSERLAVRIEDNAKLIFVVYCWLTVACIAAYILCGMGWFDGVNHALATVSTGGFGVYNDSIAHYHSPLIEWVVGIFLLLSGVNFSLFYLAVVRRRLRAAWADQELRTYLAVVAVFTGLIAWSLVQGGWYAGEGTGGAIRQAFFQVCTIITTGGFASANFDLWPEMARGLLFLLLFIGGCAGSTASGIKISRWVIIWQGLKADLRRQFRPQQVKPVHYNGKPLSQTLIGRVSGFVCVYMLLFAVGAVLLMVTGLPWLEAVQAAASTLGNVGPACGSSGPAGNYAAFSDFAKFVCSFLMLAGRLEIITVLVLFVPDAWKRS